MTFISNELHKNMIYDCILCLRNCYVLKWCERTYVYQFYDLIRLINLTLVFYSPFEILGSFYTHKIEIGGTNKKRSYAH